MSRFQNELEVTNQAEAVSFLSETSQLVSKEYANQLGSAAAAAQNANALANQVEFWKWMARNFSGKNGHMFDSAQAMQDYIARGAYEAKWVSRQVKGKGYEWDWMTEQRADPQNLFKRYFAGDKPNRRGTDVTETNLLTGETHEYQMKAYPSDNDPPLETTPNDATVVTNTERAENARKKGYDVQEFQDAKTIQKATDKRMEQAKNGKAPTTYNFRNVGGVMVKAGAIGCVIGMGVEALASFRAWKNRVITDKEYLREILKAGGDAGLTAGAAAGIMVPVSAAVTAAGMSSILTIPVAFAVSSAVNKIIAPCFGRGEYKVLLAQARYYQSLNAAYEDLLSSMEAAGEEYYAFVCQMAEQQRTYRMIQGRSMELDRDLQNLLDSI